MSKWKYLFWGSIIPNIPLIILFFAAASFLFPPWSEGITFILTVISLFILSSLILLSLLFTYLKISYIQFDLLYTFPKKVSHWVLLIIYSIMLILVIWYMSNLNFFSSPFQYGFLLLQISAIIYFYFMFNGVLMLFQNKETI